MKLEMLVKTGKKVAAISIGTYVVYKMMQQRKEIQYYRKKMIGAYEAFLEEI